MSATTTAAKPPFHVPRRRRGAFHKVADWLDDWHVTRLFSALTSFAILLAVATFAVDMIDRTEERTIRAWAVVTSPAPGNSGKIAALEYLNSEDWLFKRREPLVGIDLSRDGEGRGVYLKGAKLRNIVLADADLSGADLEDADLSDGALQNADFSGATLHNADLSGATLFRANLGSADFWKANLRGAALFEADLRHANLHEADLSGANLRQADLSGARLSGSNLSGAYLWKAVLSGAELWAVDFNGATLAEADFSGAYLGGADFDNARLGGADFGDAYLRGVDFGSASLADWLPTAPAHVFSEFAVDVFLAPADLGRADLRDADLGTVLRLTAEQIDSACLNAWTRLPRQFGNRRPPPCPEDANGKLIRE